MMLPFAVVFFVILFILLLIYKLSQVVERFTSSDEDDVEESKDIPTDSSSIITPAPLPSSTTTTTIETNMLSLNSQINYLRLKYDDLSSRVSKLQNAATMTADMENEASDLVGNTPIKIDATK
jgi:hypothetical protein